MSMTARRRKPTAQRRSAERKLPSSSGPRWRNNAAISQTSFRSAGAAKTISPANPHMEAILVPQPRNGNSNRSPLITLISLVETTTAKTLPQRSQRTQSRYFKQQGTSGERTANRRLANIRTADFKSSEIHPKVGRPWAACSVLLQSAVQQSNVLRFAVSSMRNWFRSSYWAQPVAAPGSLWPSWLPLKNEHSPCYRQFRG